MNITKTFVGKDVLFLGSVKCFILLKDDDTYTEEGEGLGPLELIDKEWFSKLSDEDFDILDSQFETVQLRFHGVKP